MTTARLNARISHQLHLAAQLCKVDRSDRSARIAMSDGDLAHLSCDANLANVGI